MVALAGLVVVTQDAFATDDQRQPVLESVCRSLHGTRNPPDDNFDEGILGEDMALLGQRLRLHVGDYANGTAMLSNAPTQPPEPRVSGVLGPRVEIRGLWERGITTAHIPRQQPAQTPGA